MMLNCQREECKRYSQQTWTDNGGIVNGLVNSGNPVPSYWWDGWVEWKKLTNLYVAIVPLNPNLGYTRKRVVNEQPAITGGLTFFCSSPHAHHFSPSLCSPFVCHERYDSDSDHPVVPVQACGGSQLGDRPWQSNLAWTAALRESKSYIYQ